MAENNNAKSVGRPEPDMKQLLKVRRDKLQALRDEGRDPFVITKYDVKNSANEIKTNFEALNEKPVSVAGRLLSKRVMGKNSFCDLSDRTGRIQLYCRIDEMGDEEYKRFKKLDIGDIVGIKGTVYRTDAGEISIRVKEAVLLSKSLLPLPEKFHGLSDTDMRYRQRYIDLIINEDVRDTFIKRSKIISSIRSYLNGQGFLEVETPMLVQNAGGAAARPFETHFNALDEDLKLRISLELYLKRLIVGGLERVYEIGRVFRNEGLDTRHNPEFTLMELYQAYTDYHGMMDLTENLYRHVAEEVLGTTQIVYNGVTMDLSKPFERITMLDAVKQYSGVDFNEIKTLEQAREVAKEHDVEFEPRHKKGDILNLFFEKYVEEKLIQPTFVMDHPVEISPLTKKKPENGDYVERFEFYMNGWEMANAYSELNDPIDQRERFKAQEEQLAQGDEEANTTDEDFLRALEIGMPPTGGIGFGIDRMCMLLTDSAAIRDVLLFPTMKSIKEPNAQGGTGSKAVKTGKSEPKTEPKKPSVSRETALALLKKYNKDEFHIRHAYTVEAVMRWYAKELGVGNEDFWGLAGLLHDIDFELYPQQHCQKAPEMLAEINAPKELVHAVVSHGYGICSDVEPTELMEKVLFASDELTGLIGACALMRPSKSCTDMELSSLKKKFKDKKFAAGCSRDVIRQGAEMLGWELDELLQKTLDAMKASEALIEDELAQKDAAPAKQEQIAVSGIQIEPLFKDFVDFDTFSKSDFRAVKVLECEAVPKSKKLLKFKLDDGTGEPRTILSGIHAYYEPEELVGKTCIAITNLPPRAMMGIDSCGMLISAVHEEEGEEKLHLLMVDDSIPAGAKLY